MALKRMPGKRGRVDEGFIHSVRSQLSIRGKRSDHRAAVEALGDGNTLAQFPTYWTHCAARVGTYSATLKLVDLGSDEERFGDSGRFTFDFRVPRRGDFDGDNDVDRDDGQMLKDGLREVGLEDEEDEETTSGSSLCW